MDDTFQDQSDDGHINTGDLSGTPEWWVWQSRIMEENNYGAPIEPFTEPIQQPPPPKQWEPDTFLMSQLWMSFLFGFGLAWIISAMRSERYE